MLNPERVSLTRRLFLQAGLVSCLGAVSQLVLPEEAQAEAWIYASNHNSIWQDPQWFPLKSEVAQARGLHTIYESGGPLDYYDSLYGTNFRQQNEEFAKDYLARMSFLERIWLDTTGYCHGVANASAYGELEPGRGGVARFIKVGLLAALHSGDSCYQPGIKQLTDDLVSLGRSFVIETRGVDGYWSRVVLAVNTGRTAFLATDFGRDPKVVELNQIKNAYVPVPESEEQNFPSDQIVVVPEEWKIGLDRELVRETVYGTN